MKHIIQMPWRFRKEGKIQYVQNVARRHRQDTAKRTSPNICCSKEFLKKPFDAADQQSFTDPFWKRVY